MTDRTFLRIYLREDTVYTDATPLFKDPFAIGMGLVDAMRTMANAYAAQEGASDARPYLDRIKAGFDAEWGKATTSIKMTKRSTLTKAELERVAREKDGLVMVVLTRGSGIVIMEYGEKIDSEEVVRWDYYSIDEPESFPFDDYGILE